MLQSVNITSKRQYIKSLSCWGIVVSTTSISFEKRARIRPVGVVSKNVRGARRTPHNMAMCMILAAAQQPSCGTRSQKNDPSAVSNITHITFPPT
jgi:hypothetical protein